MKSSASASATLDAPDEEASNEELVVEAFGKMPFDASPMMSMTGELLPPSLKPTARGAPSKCVAAKVK
jgi:hypothetical protein